MKNQKILFYLFKWAAFIFLSILIINENHSRIPAYILIGFVAAILIWEGIRDYYKKSKSQ